MAKLFSQFMRFCVVGGICFLVDYALLFLLTEYAGLNYLLSSALSFLLSTIVNYCLSMRFVFQGRSDLRKSAEFLAFVLLSLLGLGLTELLMWIGVGLAGIHYLLTKIGVTAIVLVYNFVTRKVFLESAGKSKNRSLFCV